MNDAFASVEADEEQERVRPLYAVPDLRPAETVRRETSDEAQAAGWLNDVTIAEFGIHLTRRGRAARTVKGYQHDLRQLLDWAGRPVVPLEELDDVAADWLNAYRETWSAATVKRRKAAVRKFAGWCGDRGVLADYMAPKPAQPVPHPLPGGMVDVGRLLAVADTPAKRFFVAVTGYMGLRANEALSMRLVDFDLDGRRVRVTGKGSKERWVPIPSHVVPVLADVAAAVELAGRGIEETVLEVGYRTTLRWVTAMGEAAGLSRSIATHCLRMTAGTHLYNKTKDLRATQGFLGHSDPRTTAGYTAVQWDIIAEGIEL